MYVKDRPKSAGECVDTCSSRSRYVSERMSSKTSRQLSTDPFLKIGAFRVRQLPSLKLQPIRRLLLLKTTPSMPKCFRGFLMTPLRSAHSVSIGWPS